MTTRREAAARALLLFNYGNKRTWDDLTPMETAVTLAAADAMLEAVDSFGAAADLESDFEDDFGQPELPDFYESQGLK